LAGRLADRARMPRATFSAPAGGSLSLSAWSHWKVASCVIWVDDRGPFREGGVWEVSSTRVLAAFERTSVFSFALFVLSVFFDESALNFDAGGNNSLIATSVINCTPTKDYLPRRTRSKIRHAACLACFQHFFAIEHLNWKHDGHDTCSEMTPRVLFSPVARTQRALEIHWIWRRPKPPPEIE